MAPSIFTFFCILCIFSLSVHAKAITASLVAPALRDNVGGKGTSLRILNRDLARLNRAKGKPASRMKNAAHSTNAAQGVTNSMFYYTADVYVGTPGKKYTLMLDTGSANSWIRKGYKVTKSSKRTGDKVDATYGMGYMSATEYTDAVKVAGLTAQGYSIGFATESEGFSDVGGILSLGPKALSQGTSSQYPSKQFPTFVETLFNQGAISQQIFSIYFQPTSLSSTQNGLITLGAFDTTHGTGPKYTVSKTKNKRCSRYWGFDMSFMVGNKVLGSGSGITDTGTTLILMASNVYSRYENIIAPYGATYNEDLGLIQIKSALVSRIPTVYFRVNGNKLPLVGDAQFFPEADSIALGGRRGYRYAITQDSMSDLGEDVDFMLGSKFLERFLTGYDLKTGKMQFQQTKYTMQTYSQMGKLMRRSENATVVLDEVVDHLF